MTEVRQAVLWGHENNELGEIVVGELGRETAIALSRGKFAKGYRHLDPNEDVVFAATDGDSTLLAVADGHFGHNAATAAAGHIAAEATNVLALVTAHPRTALREVALGASSAVCRSVGSVDPERAGARTALSLALVANRELFVVQHGDSRVTNVRGRKVGVVGRASPFLGPDAVPEPEIFSSPLQRGDRVVVASDGLFDFLGPNGLDRICGPAGQRLAVEVVRSLIDLAFEGGAGDNVAVAVSIVD